MLERKTELGITRVSLSDLETQEEHSKVILQKVVPRMTPKSHYHTPKKLYTPPRVGVGGVAGRIGKTWGRCGCCREHTAAEASTVEGNNILGAPR